MDSLFSHSLLVVTGKGGVGKSTVAAALGIAAHRRGLRTVVVEVAARDDISRALGTSEAAGGPRGGRPEHISIDPQRAMEEYLREQLPVGALVALLSRSLIFTTMTAATPGMRELLTIGKVWELAEQGRGGRGGRGGGPYDLVVLDAPATGHGLAMCLNFGWLPRIRRDPNTSDQGSSDSVAVITSIRRSIKALRLSSPAV
jgi:anion-transporting  ArsA/GET3 family ATPase